MQKLIIIGNRGGTNVAESFARSCSALGIAYRFANSRDAESRSRLVNSFRWRFCDRRPAKMRDFAKDLMDLVESEQPTHLISTGLVPLPGPTLSQIRLKGVTCLHYSTDDPWNPRQRSEWFLSSLPNYDIVFTPRKDNMQDFIRCGCPSVRYLPFAYDEFLFDPSADLRPHGQASDAPDVLFVGGADKDRVRFMQKLASRGIRVSLVGDYWKNAGSLAAHALGWRNHAELSALTASARVNICLVRRANRDGHVMRSFEIGAIGGCMIAEDTTEHREIFGPEGDAVLYFEDAADAAAKIAMLLANDDTRFRLGQALRRRVLEGQHSYTDRLKTMLQAAT